MRGEIMDDFEGRVSRVITGAVDATGRYPFLFIGSGLSRRYMGTPSWEELLRKVFTEVLGDAYAYPRYLSEARVAVQRGEAPSELPRLASLLEVDANRALLSEPRFAGFREENSSWLQLGGSPLRRYIANIFLGCEVSKMTEEASLLAKAGAGKVSGVITTNYDGLCEALFPNFTPYVGEDGILFRDPTFAQEIYQIHGSMKCPDSLVLTEEDYARFTDRERYLAAKLLTIFAEYPVIFLGYSLEDGNVRGILSSVARCVGPRRLENLADRLIFVGWSPKSEPSVGKQLLSFDNQVIGMTGIVASDFSPIYSGMLDSQTLYDVRALKELRGSIFSIVRRLDEKSRTIVASLDRAIETLGEGDRVVIGFGEVANDYGKSIKLVDLYRDVVLDDEMLPEALVAYEYLEDLLINNSSSVPVFKYLDAVGVSKEKCGDIGPKLAQYVSSHDSVESFLSPTQRARKEAYRSRHGNKLSVRALLEDEGPGRAFQFVPYLEDDEMDVEELGSYLSSLLVRDNKVSLDILESDTYKSEFKKCVRIYDFMKYGYKKSPGLH